MNDTLVKFGYPKSVIKSYQYWSVLLRPQQVTIGSLILASHSDAHAFGGLESSAMTELSTITKEIESVLTRCFRYDKLNYLMLMMVDPHVHFHVIPRYQNACRFESLQAEDNDWPGPPNLGQKVDITQEQADQLQHYLIEHWENN